MNTSEVLAFIDQASEEDLHILSNAIKFRKRPPRLMLSSLIGPDVFRLSQVLPGTQTEYKNKRYANTCAYYVSILTDLSNLVLHNFTIRKTARGMDMWHPHESIVESRADDFKAVFHSLTDTLLRLMDEYDTTY